MSADESLQRERDLIVAARRQAAEVAVAAGGSASPAELEGYDFGRELGRGAQGVVFEAVQRSTGQTVAIKVLPGGALAGRAHRARLEREVRVLGALDEPGICPIIDFLPRETLSFVVMPLIEGDTLRDRLAEAVVLHGEGAPPGACWGVIAGSPADRRPAARADGVPEPPARSRRSARAALHGCLRGIEAVARSIHAAHERGIVHRDLKPGNVALRGDGRPVVLDFGLALELSGDDESHASAAGPLGTPAYMAPEQVRGGRAAVDRRTDVYALGAVLYEVLTLRRPFDPGDPQLYRKIAAGELRRPRRLVPELPRDLEAVCLKALESDPERRYPTALALAEDLRRVRSHEPTLARPRSAPARVLLRARRRPLAAAALAVALLLGLVAAAERQGRAHAVDSFGRATGLLLGAVEAGEIDVEGLAELERLGLERAEIRRVVRQADLRGTDALLDELGARLRSSSAAGPAVRLLGLSDALREAPRRLTLVVLERAPGDTHLRVGVDTASSTLFERDVELAGDGAGAGDGRRVVEVPLPVELERGVVHRAWVRRPSGALVADELFGVAEPDRGPPEGLVAEAASPLAPIDRAAAALEAGLPRAALDELGRIGADAGPGLHALGEALRARAYSVLGDGAEGAAALRRAREELARVAR